MRLHECIRTPTRMYIYMYMHKYTQTHIYTYTYICTCTYTRIYAHTYPHTCTCKPIQISATTPLLLQLPCVRQERSTQLLNSTTKISATTPLRVNQYYRHACASMYTCMHIHIYMRIYIRAQPAANVLQMCMLMSKAHPYNTYNCACTGVQNTCSKVHETITAKKAHIYIHSHICIRIHMHKNTHAHP